MVAGADLPWSRVLSPATLGRSVCASVYSGIFSNGTPRSGGPAIADRGAWGGFRVACDAQYSGVRGVRSVVCVECDVSRRRAIVAKPQAQQRGMALAVAGTAGAHEPFQCAGRGDFHRHWHGAGIYLGGPAHRSILVLRFQICDHVGGAVSVSSVLPI